MKTKTVALLLEKPKFPGEWVDRHMSAVHAPVGPEKPLALMIQGWLTYADLHHSRFESLIGDDGVLGPEWEAIGDALRGLLNGEAGRFDCGTLDKVILKAMEQNGINVENK